jgi:hypothetical protein
VIEIRRGNKPQTERVDHFVQFRKRSVKSVQYEADSASKSIVAQGKPAARRGRKARDLSETARLPTSTYLAWSTCQTEVPECPT